MRGGAGWLPALLFPLLLLDLGEYELFPQVGWVDPAIYLSYFLNPKGTIEYFGSTYFATRLSFIIPGYIAHTVFKFAYANFLLVLLFHSIGILSVYFAGKKAAGTLAGVLAAWWLGCNPLWIAAISGGYVDGPAIALALAAIGLYGVGSDFGKRLPRSNVLALVGALLALSLFAHPIPAGVAALTISASALRIGKLHSSGRLIVFGGLGFALVIFFFASVMIAWTGRIYLFDDLHPLTNAFAGRAQPFIRPYDTWMPGAFRLGLPVGIVALGVTALFSEKGAPAARWLINVGLLMLSCTAAFLVGWDWFVQGFTMQSPFYSSYLLLGQSFVVAGVIAVVLKAEPRQSGFRLWLLLALLALMIVASVLLQERIGLWGKDVRQVWIVLFVLMALSAMSIILRFRQSSVWLLFLLTLLAGTANADTRRTFVSSGAVSNRDLYQHMIQIKETIDHLNTNGRRLILWVDRSEYTSGDKASDQRNVYMHYYDGSYLRLNFYDSLAGFWLWHRGVLNFEMPLIHSSNLEWLNRGQLPTTVVMVCVYPSTCNKGRAALEKVGIATTVRSSALIGHPKLYPVTILAVDYQL